MYINTFGLANLVALCFECFWKMPCSIGYVSPLGHQNATVYFAMQIVAFINNLSYCVAGFGLDGRL